MLTTDALENLPFQNLYDIAYVSVLKNVIYLDSGPYVCAGGHQFRCLWTRDFAYASFGLTDAGHHRVVKNHLQKLLKATFSNAAPKLPQVPRLMDSSPSWLRVVRHTVGQGFFPPFVGDEIEDPLTPEFEGQHGSNAIDSNALVILASCYYLEKTGDMAQAEKWEDHLFELLTYYDDKWNRDGLITQGEYTDWQDSAKRAGPTFYANFLYWQSLHALAQTFPDKAGEKELIKKANELKKNIQSLFWQESVGLFQGHLTQEFYALEDQLFVLLSPDFFQEEEKQKLYQNLKNHKLWNQFRIPGCPTTPSYPLKWISPANRSVGLRHYHDGFLWSWLIALSGLVAYNMDDPQEAKRIFETFQSMATRDGTIAEIYSPKGHLSMVDKPLYHSETPFSWGAGVTLFALHHCQWQ